MLWLLSVSQVLSKNEKTSLSFIGQAGQLLALATKQERKQENSGYYISQPLKVERVATPLTQVPVSQDKVICIL